MDTEPKDLGFSRSRLLTEPRPGVANRWHLPQVEGALTTTNREPDALTRIAAALERRCEQEDGKLMRERLVLVASVEDFSQPWSVLHEFDRMYPWIAAKAEASE